MRIIILTNDPCAREVFDLTRKTNAALVMDFRNGDILSRPNGLTYSLGSRYRRFHHHFFPAAVINRVRQWTRPELPMIILINKGTTINDLRSTILCNYPLTEIVEGEPCAA
jgi:hypothetical protein